MIGRRRADDDTLFAKCSRHGVVVIGVVEWLETAYDARRPRTPVPAYYGRPDDES
jgi:hypothetical protein